MTTLSLHTIKAFSIHCTFPQTHETNIKIFVFKSTNICMQLISRPQMQKMNNKTKPRIITKNPNIFGLLNIQKYILLNVKTQLDIKLC